ncbi:MAG: bifunctional 5,10-methylenetetrahydrofolate dehydrogenase/5,10-methenyltetrahydrofolate cyclohydrolase [Tenericutes bacterium]|nr:bifunctional 5,10-methylenetetrahydrofolate dehydrogenase/5,10-methenyltetrahydrofolate cyclohydrolase [Mycoplasmatota bacterium]
MNLKLLDGKVVKTMALEGLKKLVNEIERPLGLTVIQVGDNASSNIYIKQKRKMAEFLGFNFNHIKLEDDVTLEWILRIIDELNNDEEVDGILVQMPVSEHLDSKVIQNAINPLKDVDGLTDINMGKLVHKKECLVPCTALGIMELLNYYNIPVISKNVVVVGRSDLVGRPVAELLINASATVTLCHSKTKDLASITRGADILIVAVGKSRLITKDMVKDGAVVIDVGINKLEDGSLCGDVDFENVKDKCSYITPVPGGVGQMTVLELGFNTYKAYLLRHK